MTPRERFLTALQGGPTDRPCVGSATSMATVGLMERSGHWFPEAHLDPSAMCGLAATCALVLGYDNIAPVFSVQHEAEALGCEVDWGAPKSMPAAKTHPWRSARDVAIPDDLLDRRSLVVVLEALGMLRDRWAGEYAIVGKVFGPWTLAYHLFGVEAFLMMTLDDPAQVHEILAQLKEVAVAFGAAQIEAGADVLTLADHATGDLVSPRVYEAFLAPIHAELAERIGCPLILHICGNTKDRLRAIANTGLCCFHFESKVPAAEARRIVGDDIRLMGNLNNPEVLLNGTPAEVARAVRAALEAGVDIVGPECAVPLTTPIENLQAVREAAEAWAATR
jgi:[methyl-Co(III) methanol-specific corrinoid protein]:coenzyme M methyltransferase